MNQPDGPLPEELEAVAARLRGAKAQADPLQLGQIKQRVMRNRAQTRRSMFMKERLATFATIFALVGGTGGAVAIAGGNGDNGQGNGGAAHGQYCEGHEKHHGKGGNRHKGDDCGQGDDNHHHEHGGMARDQGNARVHHAKDAKSTKGH